MRTLAIWLALHVPAPASWRPWLLGAALGRRPRKVAPAPDARALNGAAFKDWPVLALLAFLALPLAAQTQPDPFHLAPGGSNGTVTSVGLSMPAEFSVSGSPVTSSGTFAVTEAAQAPNTCYAGPTSGGAAAPSFRSLVLADLPFTGTPTSSVFARGDGAWATPAGAAGSPYNRVVIVDPAGGGDYTTIDDAVAFVNTQTRSDSSRWVIELEPGPDYAVAAPFALTYTTIRGQIPHSIFPFYGQARIVSPSISSGTFITLNAGGALASVNVRFTGTLTGAARVIEVAGSAAALADVTIENNASTATQPLSLVETVSGTTTGFVAYYNYWISVVSATNLTYFKHQNNGTTYIVDSLARSSTGAAAIIHNTSTGTISLIRSAFGPFYSTNSDPNTFSLKNDSTGKIEPMMTSFWGPTSGTIDDWHQVARARTFVDTPFATCTATPAEVAIDIGTVKRVCVCTAANTWSCERLDGDALTVSRIATTGPAPSVSACGTSPSVSGNDTAGTVTVGTGVVTDCTVTFSSARASTPRVVGLVPNIAVACGVTAKSTTAFTVTCAATIAGGTFDYLVVE